MNLLWARPGGGRYLPIIQSGGIAHYGGFDYAVVRCPNAEGVAVDRVEESGHLIIKEFFLAIRAGVTRRCREWSEQGHRLCAARVSISRTWHHEVDTDERVMERRGWEFVQGVLEQEAVTAGPFDPAWRTSSVVALARSARTGAVECLPVLADALQDAGCELPLLLEHCRAGGEHAGDCWAVEMVLGAGRHDQGRV